MSEGFAGLDAHAYVDNSLSVTDRVAFEAAARRDAKLRARVETWEAQNEAIRLAFGAAARQRPAPSLHRPINENNAAGAPASSRGAELRCPGRGREGVFLRPQVRRGARWVSAALGGVAFLAAFVGFAGGPRDPRPDLVRRADTILRASAAFADTKLDFVSDDPVAVSAWLGGRFARLDAKRLKPPGWSLLGARIVPGLNSAAALVLYEDALGGRAALMVEPTDGTPPLPPLGERDSDETRLAGTDRRFAYAVVGPTRSGVGALIPSESRD